MDIESMHPFCMPFSLCHDATSSTMTSCDDDSSTMDPDRKHRTNDQNDKGSSNERSTTSSPSDELFTQMESNSSSCGGGGGGRSLFDDDDIIMLKQSPDEPYYSLYLDMDIDATTDCLGHNGDNHNCTTTDLTDDDFGFHEDFNIDGTYRNDDWCPTDYSLFSISNTTATTTTIPTNTTGIISRRRRSSIIKTAAFLSNHQVFQHVVDPLDIKSSPTLAQLNLNSNDDPTDGLWDTTTPTTASTSTSIAVAATTMATALISNSTSILTSATNASSEPDLLSNCINRITSNCSDLTLCNHLHSNSNNNNYLNHHQHHHHHQNHHHQHNHLHHHPMQRNQNENSFVPYVTHLGNTSHAQHCSHNHANLHDNNKLDAVSNHQSYCCQSSRLNNNFACTPNSPSLTRNQHEQRLELRDQKLNQSQIQPHCGSELVKQTMHSGNVREGFCLNQNQIHQAQSGHNQQQPHQHQDHSNQQQRSASPALVTSSSSPLSSTMTLAHNTIGESRQIDNKLKENIEYLTALLCNGSDRLDCNNQQPQQQQQQHQQQQQASISSTMVKTYTTLAQSLSTGPRLLERQQAVPMQHCLATSPNVGQPLSTRSPNEASPQTIGRTQAGFFGAGDCPNSWFKQVTVESSVSAADSTAESNNMSTLANRTQQVQYSSMQQQRPQSNMIHESNMMSPIRQPETGVLSSLLSSNSNQPPKCPTSVWHSDCNHNHGHVQVYQAHNQHQHHQQQQLPSSMGPVDCNRHLQSVPSTCETTNQSHNNNSGVPSIPQNGRPITLTPVNNTIIVQPPKVKTPMFAQPASPSASSTASSGGITDNHLSGIQSLARSQRASNMTSSSSLSSNTARGNSSTSDRSARPNSMSTECSLSSHDEGFSSQVDNEDCASTRDSDDDDDVDSDDESFYGDYTNSDLIGASISDNAECKWTLNMGRTRRNGQRRFFWQYNVQSKGPKGVRICPTDGSDDPFVLPEASDPVFSSDCHIEGVKHSGKARRGDGNDLTPNPKKLLMIGLELKKLGKIINDLVPVTDLPLNARNKTRKEKNKLASRACRLKKKAQHEANKIKLYGLQLEHQQVVGAIYDVRKFLREKLMTSTTIQKNEEHQQLQSQSGTMMVLSSNVETLAERCSMTVAGQTSDYVNSVLEKVVSGCIDGGLS